MSGPPIFACVSSPRCAVAEPMRVALATAALAAECVSLAMREAAPHAYMGRRRGSQDAIVWLRWWWCQRVCVPLSRSLDGVEWWEGDNA